jgi:hypothetical protein
MTMAIMIVALDVVGAAVPQGLPGLPQMPVTVVVIVVLVMVIAVVIAVVIHVGPAVEMFGLTPHQGRADHRLNGDTAPVGQAPLHHHAKQAIHGVVTGAVVEVVLQPSVAFDGEHRGHLKLAGGQVGTTSGAVGQHRTGYGAGQGQNP